MEDFEITMSVDACMHTWVLSNASCRFPSMRRLTCDSKDQHILHDDTLDDKLVKQRGPQHKRVACEVQG